MYDVAYDNILVAVTRVEEAKAFAIKYPSLASIYKGRQRDAEKQLKIAIKLFASLDS